jgi:hypothetical protein
MFRITQGALNFTTLKLQKWFNRAVRRDHTV